MPSGAALTTVSTSAKKSAFRADVQGLRMVAVLVVVLDHLFGWPSGGFVGVDIFFVISGFMITGILLREHAKTGRISFVDFYKRRVKRILPASTLVLIVTVVTAYVVFNLARAQETLIDGLWAALFSANWRYASVGTDYFAAEGAPSPLQHFWSLAVEEQFYFVWPWILLAVLLLVARRSSETSPRGRLLAGACMAAIIVATFSFALWQSVANPTVAYFSTLTRSWELGLGALVAIASPLLLKLPTFSRPLLAWLGLLGIVASLFVIDSASTFPAPWAALPVASTALVLAAGTGGEQRFLWPLTNRGSVYIGNISYSLYLWHWPIIVFLAVLIPEGPLYFAVALILIAQISVVAYHFVEDPIRTSSWLSGLTQKQKRTARKNRHHDRTGQRARVVGGVGALASLALVLTFLALSSSPAPSLLQARPAAEFDQRLSGDFAEDAAAPAEDGPTSALQDELRASLSSSSWPELSPSVNQLGRGALVSEWVTDGCLALEQGALADPAENAARCVYGDPDASNVAVLTGDSVGISWLPAIRQALGSNWSIHVFAMMQCPVADISLPRNDGSPFPQCDDFRAWTSEQIAALSPSLTIVANSDVTARVGNALQIETADAFAPLTEATTSALSKIVPGSQRTVVLVPPPSGEGFAIAGCMTNFNRPSDCSGRIGERMDQLVATFKDASAAAGGAEVVDTRKWFCVDDACPSFAGSTPIRGDQSHLSQVYSEHLGAVMREALLPEASDG
jgi:peptidoglycan/LPS O-acetylase OafA/YrhL